MSLKFWLAMGGAAGAIALAVALWLWLKGLSNKAAQVDVLRHENQTAKEVLNDIGQAKHIREKLTTDPAYAQRVRKKYQRD